MCKNAAGSELGDEGARKAILMCVESLKAAGVKPVDDVKYKDPEKSFRIFGFVNNV